MTQSPVPISAVLTPLFTLVAMVSVLLVFSGFYLDGVVAGRWPFLSIGRLSHPDLEEKLVRLATGAFFLLLWDKGAVVLWEPGDAILTPELTANLAWMGALQFAIALSVAWRPTCILAAAGITLLYGYGVRQFGLFHMTDYVFFLGFAAYLALTSIGGTGARRYRVPLLSGGLAFGLMWTAVEKFLYPEWTLSVIAAHPDLTFGFPFGFVTVVAGFVEFTLAFFFMTSRGLVRLGAAGYAAIFLAAIPEFGHLDAVGHIPIIGILAVIGLRGPSPLCRLLGLRRISGILYPGAIAALYVTTLMGFFVMYYGLQWAEYG